jgi:hypothetical protein
MHAAAVTAALRGVAAREPRIIMDLAGLEFIDASGVAALAVVPIARQPTKMRWQRIAMNPPAPRRRAVTGDWLPRGSWAPRCRPPAVGGISG